jgi:hypothetical protein
LSLSFRLTRDALMTRIISSLSFLLIVCAMAKTYPDYLFASALGALHFAQDTTLALAKPNFPEASP